MGRVRVIHPDRIDRQRQPQDWKKANEMLVELNEAYSNLQKLQGRRGHDKAPHVSQSQPTEAPPSPPETAPPPPSFEAGEFTPGKVSYAKLPQDIQARLCKRQLDAGEDQFQIKQASARRHYYYIAISSCWYLYIFLISDGIKWREETLFLFAAVSLVVGLLIGRNIVILTRRWKATLKHCFYVTPIYFIKTHYDVVSFYPIWSLKDSTITHHEKNGSYLNSNVVLKFEGGDEEISVSSKFRVEKLFAKIYEYDNRLRLAYARQDKDYFRVNDDFYRAPRSGLSASFPVSKGVQAAIYVGAVFMSMIGLCIAIVVNDNLSSKPWLRHPVPHTSAQKSASPNDPYAAFVPLAPDAVPSSSGHVSQRETKPSYPEQPLPISGSVQIYTSDEQVAPFEIKAALGNHYLLKLVNTQTHEPVQTIFVQSGASVKVHVPLGSYEVRYASGTTWYGYEYLFGPDTSCCKADTTFTFRVEGNQVSGYTITLYKVAHGNLHTSAISPTEF